MSIHEIRQIDYKDLHMIISGAPSENQQETYLKEFQKLGVTDIIRTCELTYDEKLFTSNNIKCHSLEFDDGKPPPPDIIDKYIDILEERDKKSVFVVHCIAGIGRAPTMVVIGLIEIEKVDPAKALSMVCKEGDSRVMTDRQLEFIRSYKTGCGCIIM